MRIAADNENGADVRVLAEPSRERIDRVFVELRVKLSHDLNITDRSVFVISAQYLAEIEARGNEIAGNDKGAPESAPFLIQSIIAQDDAPPEEITVTPRRFCAQQLSFDSVHVGRSLP